MMMEITKLKNGFLFLVGIVLSVFMFKTLMVHTDNTQLMDKAYLLVQKNEWIHAGNAVTKMGSLPGSFLTVLTALPMKIFFSPYMSMLVLLAFHSGSLFFLIQVGRKHFSEFSLFSLLVIYWLNPWRVEQFELYNPGYLFLFSGLHLYCHSILFEKKSFWASLLLVLTIGFCFQTHFSVLILGLLSLYLFLFKKVKLNWWGILIGCFLTLLSLVPWYLQKQNLAVTALQTQADTFFGKNLLLVYPVLKAALYYFRFGSMYFGRHIFSEINFEWIQNDIIKIGISTFFHFVKFFLALVSFYFSFNFLFNFLKNYFSEISFLKFKDQNNSFTTSYGGGLFLAVIGAAALSPVEFNHWHLILAFPFISLLVSQNFKSYIKITHFLKLNDYLAPISTKKLLNRVALVFIIWSLFAALGSRSHSYKNNYHDDLMNYYKEKFTQ